jgi:hypothetical protein
MEERVRACRACRAIIGWYALFCESCGAKQDHGDAPGPAPARTGEVAAPDAPPPPAEPRLEDEVRTHLAAPAGDARAVARDLFQTQLRLIHKNREGVESLLSEVRSMEKELAAAGRASGKDARKRILDSVSGRMYEAEQTWGELQVSYNRDSELIEEEGREHMEAADFDAYLSPDENAKMEAEFSTLRAQFENADASLRDLGRGLSRARQESESRYLLGLAGGGRRPWALLIVTAVLAGFSTYSGLFVYEGDPLRLAACAGPLALALAIWLIYGFSRSGR